MKKDEFDNYNKIFNQLITPLDLNESMNIIDEKTILSRVFQKINEEIKDELLISLINYNVYIIKKEYERAQNVKEYIIKFL